MLTKNNICDKMGISFLRREIMVKRIVSSALALVLLATSLVFLGVALINIVEPFVQCIAYLIENGFSEIGRYIGAVLDYRSNRMLINPMRLGVPAKLIISGLLFVLAIYIISYKENKMWGIIRKLSGIATSALLIIFAVQRVLFVLERSIIWLLVFARTISYLIHGYYRHWILYLFEDLKTFGILSFAIFLSLVVAIICVVLAVYIMIIIFKKNQTREQVLEKKKQAIKKKLSKLQDMQANNVAYVSSTEEKTAAKTETKVELDPNGAIIVKFN